jgi:hypothetical protein
MRTSEWGKLQPQGRDLMLAAHSVVKRALDLVADQEPSGRRRLWAGYESLLIGVTRGQDGLDRVAVLQDPGAGGLEVRFRAVIHPA